MECSVQTSRELSICSLNICGMSVRSKFMLDKYVNDNNTAVLGLQETGTIDDKLALLNNMSYIKDSNNAQNKARDVYCTLVTN